MAFSINLRRIEKTFRSPRITCVANEGEDDTQIFVAGAQSGLNQEAKSGEATSSVH